MAIHSSEIRRQSVRFVGACAVLLLAAACGSREMPAPAAAAAPAGAAGPGTDARPPAPVDAGVDLADCLRDAGPDACPAFIKAAVADALPLCKEMGGTLRAMAPSSVPSVDVDGDGRSEYLFDFSQGFSCDTAPSLYSCGSLGCPTGLYRQQGGTWSAVGWLDASDAPGLELLPDPRGSGFALLRGGCAGDRPCDQLTTYAWNGTGYEVSRVEVRGHAVMPAPDGLWTLTADTTVLATPTKDSAVLDRYTAGTEVVVLGRVEETDYLYVSPCNACASGFVPAGVLKK